MSDVFRCPSCASELWESPPTFRSPTDEERAEGFELVPQFENDEATCASCGFSMVWVGPYFKRV